MVWEKGHQLTTSPREGNKGLMETSETKKWEIWGINIAQGQVKFLRMEIPERFKFL